MREGPPRTTHEVTLARIDDRPRPGPEPWEVAPELVIGLVGATGTDLAGVKETLHQSLRRVGYEPHLIRLSELPRELPAFKDLRTSPEDDRIRAHMDAGDELRRRTERPDAMALLAVNAIRDLREDITGDPEKPAFRHAYVLHSLKHPKEVAALRSIYDRRFFLMSVFAPRKERLHHLAQRIARSHHAAQSQEFLDKAQELMIRDEADAKNRYGQNVRETFPHADVFVNSTHPAECRQQVERFVRLLFGYPYHTPRKDEYGMFHARAAALRSADLSRQVGAAVATPEGEIVAVGTNDIPKAGGGQYWENDADDHRDFVLGHDTTTEMKTRMLAEVLNRLAANGLLKEELVEKTGGTTRAKTSALQQAPSLMAGTQLMSTTEFGRSVHAEMAAISDAAKRGAPLRGCTLYTTTFPCHNCAKHVVAAGISRVVFVEPYPKSLAADLYPDSISIEEEIAGKVPFRNFVGVAPSRYIDFFSMPERKGTDGRVLEWESACQRSLPRLPPLGTDLGYVERETVEIIHLNRKMIKAGLIEGLHVRDEKREEPNHA